MVRRDDAHSLQVPTAEDLADQQVGVRYLHIALAGAEYKILEDGTVFGSIPGFQGVWADEKTFTACHTELESALQDWVNYRLAHGLDLPELADTPTPVTLVAACCRLSGRFAIVI